MALDSWIDSAARTPGRLIGADRLMDAHLLAMPEQDRAAALLERERARRAVRRLGGQHGDELLLILGLNGETG